MNEGSRRFGRLIRAANDGKTLPPADIRYLQKGIPSKATKSTDTSRQRVVSFLQGVYDSIAETLPDIRDETCDFDSTATVIKVPEGEDPYVKAFSLPVGLQANDGGNKGKGTKIRRRKFSIALNTERKEAQEIRFLPPGHIREYWEQMKVSEARGSTEKPVAFSTFWRVWHQEFGFLKFRPTSSHGQCATCLRHKLLIKAMQGHMNARQKQVSLYVGHLRSQYLDRLRYWELRGTSRLRSPHDCLIILDGMDQAKFNYPRGVQFTSKELQGLSRPRAHISGCIAHGRLILFTVSAADVAKDANSCIETTAHVLHLLSQETDLRMMTLHVQADNTAREVKNNHYIRFLGSLVTHRTSRLKNTIFETGGFLTGPSGCVTGFCARARECSYYLFKMFFICHCHSSNSKE